MKFFGKLLVRVFLVCLGVVLPLLVLEAGVRILDLAPPADLQPALWAPHPYLGWFHVPNRGGVSYSEYGEFKAPVHINARGLRDREIGYDNPQGAYRVLVLGDSFAEALQVPLEDTFVKLAETELSREDGPVEVINGGVGGWGTDQEALFYMVEGFRYQPDLVLLFFFVHNDTLNNYEPLEVARNHGKVEKPFFHLQNGELVPPDFPFEPPEDTPADADQAASPPLLGTANWLQGHAALYRLLSPYVREVPALLHTLGPTGILGGMAAFMAQDTELSPSYFVYQADPSSDWQAAWELTGQIIEGLNREVEADGSRLAVVIIGAPEQIYPERWQRVLDQTPSLQATDWDLAAPNRRLTAILDRAGIPYVDLLPIFRQAAQEENAPPLHFAHDGHWTPAGHRLAAEAITSFVQQLRLQAPAEP